MPTADIAHYLEAAEFPFGRFRTLTDIVFARDARDRIDFRAGSRAVIFRVSAGERDFAMKCYTKTDADAQKRLAAVAEHLDRGTFLPEELFVYDDAGRGAYWPVWLSEWIEGTTLRGWLFERCGAKDRAAIGAMARRFTEWGLALLEQEWAHGDLKPENIIVTPEGELRLIDFDGAFVPALAGTRAPELGTPGFRHPLRDERFYDRHLDDYAIAGIATALYALAECPEAYDPRDDDRLLFDPARAVAGRDETLNRLRAHWRESGERELHRLAGLPGWPSPGLPELTEVLKSVRDTERKEVSAPWFRAEKITIKPDMKPSYVARITRKTPSAFVFLIDLSGSMEEKVQFNGATVAKSAAVAELINKTVAELVHRCKREEGYRDYLDIAVIGYGGEQVWSLLPEGGTHPVFRKPDELAYARVDTVKTFRERILPDGNKVLSSMETKAWVVPTALGKTPMSAALQEVYKLLYDWTRRHAAEECFPPVIINISDGEATDAEEAELLSVSEKLRELKTADGGVLLFNIFIGHDPAQGAVLFPDSEDALPETPFARLLFRMSSSLPQVYHAEVAALTGSDPSTCRGMSYNASLNDLVGLLNIGSLSVTRLS